MALESFGDSSLNFVLRAHVATLSQRLPTIHELNATILEEFRRAGIEIPYPQRDLHLRTLPPGFPGRGGPDKSA